MHKQEVGLRIVHKQEVGPHTAGEGLHTAGEGLRTAGEGLRTAAEGVLHIPGPVEDMPRGLKGRLHSPAEEAEHHSLVVGLRTAGPEDDKMRVSYSPNRLGDIQAHQTSVHPGHPYLISLKLEFKLHKALWLVVIDHLHLNKD